MLLHTVNKSPFNNGTLESCLQMSKNSSGILFIEDGVYGAITGSKVAATVEAAVKSKKIYALGPDLKARGIADRVIDGIEVVDYAGFVDLATEFDGVEAWL